jgi:hypothetical protein
MQALVPTQRALLDAQNVGAPVAVEVAQVKVGVIPFQRRAHQAHRVALPVQRPARVNVPSPLLRNTHAVQRLSAAQGPFSMRRMSVRPSPLKSPR